MSVSRPLALALVVSASGSACLGSLDSPVQTLKPTPVICASDSAWHAGTCVPLAQVMGVRLSSVQSADPTSTPIATWTVDAAQPWTSYEAAVFSSPGLVQQTAWARLDSPSWLPTGIDLESGQTYQVGVRVVDSGRRGPLAYSPPWQVTPYAGPPLIVSDIVLTSASAPLIDSPAFNWRPTSYPGLSSYQYALFDYPTYQPLGTWQDTTEHYAELTGLTLTDGHRYVAGIRIMGQSGVAGPVAFTPPWLADAQSAGQVPAPTMISMGPFAAGNDLNWQNRLARILSWTPGTVASLVPGTAYENLVNPSISFVNGGPGADGTNWDATGNPRTKVDCSSIPRGKLAVIVVAGQSNSTNTGSGAYTPHNTFYQLRTQEPGVCYVAKNPLLGIDWGDQQVPFAHQHFAVQLADQLIDDKRYDSVLLVPIGVGGTFIETWVPSAGNFERFDLALDQLADLGLEPTHILWVQGEANKGPSAAPAGYTLPDILELATRSYEYHFVQLAQGVRARTQAPIFVATASFCGGGGGVEIERAQRELPDITEGIFRGADIDAYGSAGRQGDQCHLNPAGITRHARDWANIITAYDLGHPSRSAVTPGDWVALAPNGALTVRLNEGHSTFGDVKAMGQAPDLGAFADLDGDGLSDLIEVGSDGSIRVRLNRGDLTFGDAQPIGQTTGRAVFADVNADRRADLIKIEGGMASVQLNRGGLTFGAAQLLGAGSDGLTFADLDGDGWADQVEVGADGAMSVRLNSSYVGYTMGQGGDPLDLAVSFGAAQPLGPQGVGAQLADVDGDGRADLVDIDASGSVRVRLNTGGMGFADPTALGASGGSKVAFVTLRAF